MSRCEFALAERNLRELDVLPSTTMRVVKESELKAYEYVGNSSLLRCRQSDIEVVKLGKRGE
jgi:hypothetical protein